MTVGRVRARALRRAVAALLVGAVAVTALGACTATRRLSAGLFEEWTEQPFYTAPDPVPPGEPGTLVRSEELASAPDGARAWRVLYHSTDLRGAPLLVSGVVVVPDGPAPPGGRTVVSWGHPTTGMAARCAPSVGIDPFDTIEGLRDLLDRGYIVAASDFAGMGLPGPTAYLIGETEGRNVLDAARAARELARDEASDRLVLWGHSQGGQAVLFAGQLAGDYAPELELRAVAAAAPAADLAKLLDADIGDVSGVTIASYAFVAYEQVYGSTTPGASLDTILTPAAVDSARGMSELCLFGQNQELHAAARPLVGGFLKSDPATTEPWATLLTQNTPGATGLPVPLFIAQGDTDTLVRPELTDAFVAHERALGTEVGYERIADTGHGLVALRALPKLLPWLERLAPATE